MSERGSTQSPKLRVHLTCVSTNGPDHPNLIKQKGVKTYGDWFGDSNAIGPPVTARPMYPAVIMSSTLWHSCTNFPVGQEIAHAFENSLPCSRKRSTKQNHKPVKHYFVNIFLFNIIRPV